MSKEAVGQMNAKIGSSEYWSRVNHNTMLGGLMGAKTNYQATLRELGSRASVAIEEIYGDLSNLNSRIRFLDASNRNALAKQVEGLYDVCKMSGVTVWYNSECVQGLNLSMMSPWTRNFRDERGIEKAIAIINKTRYSEREVVDLLKDASKWGIAFACGSDRAKRAFLETVAQGSISSRFLEDVAEEYQNQSSRQSYEGGDPAKIKELQKALNNLGVGQHLKEDGVYGPKTETAVDKAINEISNFLTDKKKIGALATTIDALVAVAGRLSGCQRYVQAAYNVIEKGRDIFQRAAWKWIAVDWFLPQRNCNVAALLLEHSLERTPSDLHFSQSHWVTERVIQSKGFQKAFAELEQNLQENPDVYAVNGKTNLDFQWSGDTDLYYGIGKCTLKYTCIRHPSSVSVKFFIEDRYDFDHIRTIRGDVERFIIIDPDVGPLANDFGLISQADGVISNYHIFITFEKTIELN